MPERRNIFEYTAPAGGTQDYFVINREADGSVTVNVSGASVPGYLVIGHEGIMKLPAAQVCKLVAALALEPDLWPGCDCDIKAAQAEIGKPHGGALS